MSDEDKTELEITPPKRLCLTPNTSNDIPQFGAQLLTDSRLTDDVLESVTRVLRAEYPSTKMVILDPLWFQGDAAEPLPIHSANLQRDGATYCFPIHHGRAQHWTLGSFQIEHAAKRVSVRFYDSMDCDERAAVVDKRMREWLGGIDGGYSVMFERVVRFPFSAY